MSHKCLITRDHRFPALVQAKLNVELFYFFGIREKTDWEPWKKKSLKHFVYSEPLSDLSSLTARVRHIPGPPLALWNSQYLQ